MISSDNADKCTKFISVIESESLFLRGLFVGSESLAQPHPPPGVDGASAGSGGHLVAGCVLFLSAGRPSAAAARSAAPGQLCQQRTR